MYANIRKCLRYLLTTNLGDGIQLIAAAVSGKEIPINPLQLLWLNITSDPLIAWLLANDLPAEKIMDLPPRKAGDKLLDKALTTRLIRRSLLLGTSSIAATNWARKRGEPLAVIQTLTLLTLTLGRIFHLQDCRQVGPVYPLPLPPNPKLFLAAAWMLLPISAAIYLPSLRTFFRTASLQRCHWQTALMAAGAGFAADRLAEAFTKVQLV